MKDRCCQIRGFFALRNFDKLFYERSSCLLSAGLFFLVLIEYKKGNVKSILVVFLFFIFFAVKVLGAIVHYFLYSLPPMATKYIWMLISTNSVLLTYCLLYSLDVPNIWRRSALFASVVLSLIFSIETYFDSARYGLDVYHIFLIISTFILYLSLIRGDWTYPQKKSFYIPKIVQESVPGWD
jgi:hypothetical protein